MTTINTLTESYRKAIIDVVAIEKQMCTKSFRSLSEYSKRLVKDDYEKAVSKQFDVVENIATAITDNIITQDQGEAIIKGKYI